jgi:hypothetical protein
LKATGNNDWEKSERISFPKRRRNNLVTVSRKMAIVVLKIVYLLLLQTNKNSTHDIIKYSYQNTKEIQIKKWSLCTPECTCALSKLNVGTLKKKPSKNYIIGLIFMIFNCSVEYIGILWVENYIPS